MRDSKSRDAGRVGQFFPIRRPVQWAKLEIYETTFALILAALAAVALFGGLVYAALVAAHVSEPSATTVYGLTPRRFWATAAAVLALAGVVIASLADPPSAAPSRSGKGRKAAMVAGVAAPAAQP